MGLEGANGFRLRNSEGKRKGKTDISSSNLCASAIAHVHYVRNCSTAI